MITLESLQTVYGTAPLSGSISYTFMGLELSGSIEVYKILSQGQLSSSIGLLYSVPSLKSAFIKQVLFSNVSTSSIQNIKLYIGGTSSHNQIITFAIPSSGSAKYDLNGWMIYDSMGATMTSQISAMPLTTILDDPTSSTISYVGAAMPGSNQADPVWRISRLDETVGAEIKWADGNTNFDNIWNNRNLLNYS